MASGIYNQFYHSLGLGDVDWISTEQHLALIKQTYAFDKTETVWAGGSDPGGKECTDGNGYTTGGEGVGAGSIIASDTRVRFDKSDVTFAGLDKTFQYGVLYGDTGNLMLCFDAGITSGSSGDVVFQWNAAGLVAFSQKA